MTTTPNIVPPAHDLTETYGPDFWCSYGGTLVRGHGPRTEHVDRLRREAIEAACRVLVESDLAIAQMTPREQAEAAWTPTTPFRSLEELEDVIRARRGMPPVHLSPADLAAAIERHAARGARRRQGGDAEESSTSVGGEQ